MAGGGAEDFLKFINDGEAQWSLLAAKAPIADVSNAFAKFAKTAHVDRNVPIKPEGGGNDEVAPATAVVQVRDNPWVVISRTLFYVNEAAINEVTEATAALSKSLKTQVLAFAAADESEAIACDLFEDGKQIKHADDIEAAKEMIRKLGIYLPARYPQIKGKRSWLAVAKISADKVERADLVAIKS